MRTPLISVVLPTFNAEAFVAASIRSILAQSFGDFELFVIDDGSTDASLIEMRGAVSGDPRCIVVSRENRGLVATCNEGIERSTGRYVFRMDADDVAHPERFAKQVAYLENHPECLALGTRVMLADEALMPIVEAFTSTNHEQIDEENLRGEGSAICHPSAAIRRDVLVSLGGYRAEFEWAEDLDLFLRAAERGKLANLPDVLLTYRQHLSSIGYSKRAMQRARTARAVQEAKARRGWPSDADENVAGPFGDSVMQSDYGSVGAIHRKWAWLALIGGHPQTARKHAWRALVSEPAYMGNFRLMACAIRGH